MAAIDWTDPCARALALRNAYYALISGEGEQLIRTRGPEAEREVRFAKTNIELLKSELAAAEKECAEKNGTPPTRRRFAIRGGAMRRCL